jgi:GT2 family glycosyltransferase
MIKYNLAISIVLYKTDMAEIINVIQEVQNTDLKYKIFLVDNSPTNAIKANIPLSDKVEYIHTGENLGFGAGHNIAINRTKGIAEYHLVLNADVIFKAEILNTIYNYMVQNNQIGLLAPKIYNLDDTIQYSAKLLPTPMNLIVRRFLPIKFIQNKLDYNYELKFFNFDKIIEVPYVMGCFMFINTNVFDVVNGFDERFFMYPEDIDLTRRIYKKYKTIYYPLVSIKHKHGKGSYKSNKLLYYHVTSMIKYFNKWGWIFDKERRLINKNILSQFELND